MRAVVLCQIPYAHTSSTITADDLALVGVDNNIIDRRAMGIASLNRTTSCLPDLHRAIFRACDHPFALAMKCNTSNIASMTFERKQRVRVCRFDIVKLDAVVAGSSKEPFVRRYA